MGKYNPDDYRETMPVLADEMIDFEEKLSKYKLEQSEENYWYTDKAYRDLLFAIKHRVVEGFLNRADAEEMREYYGSVWDGASEFNHIYKRK